MQKILIAVVIFLVACVKLQAQTGGIEFNVHPDRAAEKFTIQVKQAPAATVTIRVHNVFGQNIIQKDLPANVGLTNIYGLKKPSLAVPGTYLVEVISGSDVTRKTVTVE